MKLIPTEVRINKNNYMESDAWKMRSGPWYNQQGYNLLEITMLNFDNIPYNQKKENKPRSHSDLTNLGSPILSQIQTVFKLQLSVL